MDANQQQSEAWNGPESEHWIEHADGYDRQFAPITDALFGSLALGPGDAVLDVGCGCGALARRAAKVGRRVLGADISKPFVAVATDRARAESLDNVDFLVADAQTYAFPECAYDLVISQFGLMFFDRPVTAFANLRRSLVSGGRITFACWQGLEANELVTIVADAATKHASLPSLGGLAGGPGMFALQDPDEIAALLDQSGFTGVEIQPVSRTVLVGGGGTLGQSVEFLLNMGIARGLLSHAEPEPRSLAIEEIRGSMAGRYEPGVGVQLGTAVWLVSATK